MAKKFVTPIDLNGLELRNALVQSLATAPTHAAGRIYFDTTQSKFGVSDGAAWTYLATGGTDTEAVQDIVAALVKGTQVVATYDDTNATLTLTIGAGVITDTHIASNAAISADKIADGTTNKVFTSTEKTKLAGVATGATANSADSYLLDRAHHTGTQAASTISDFQSAVSGNADVAANTTARHTHSNKTILDAITEAFTTALKTKLDGIQAGATANASDSFLRDRTNHTGTQAASTISDLATVVKGYLLNEFGAPSADLSLNGHKITGLGDPSSSQDAATKGYVDATAQGLDVKQSVRVSTTDDITLSGLQTIDGYAVQAGDRVLVLWQTDSTQNGIYVAASGAWARAADADSNNEVNPGLFTFVENGDTYASSGWVLATQGAITLGTTALDFSQFSGAGTYAAGTGLTLSGAEFDVGAGNGIIVTSSAVAIDTAIVVSKYATNVPSGSTSAAVDHGLQTADVTVAAYEVATGAEVEADVIRTTTNRVTLGFAVAPTEGQYRVVIHG